MFKNINKILTFFLLIVGTSYSEDCFQTGECRDSFFFTGAPTSDEYACLDFCNSENGCNWLSFNPTTSFCKLFGNCLVLDTQYCNNCLTSHADCIPDEPSCWVEGNCVGIALHSEQTLSAEDCLQLCDSTFGCSWFTFFTFATECVLFQSCTTIDQSCVGCISGERRCIQGLFSSSTVGTWTPTITTTSVSPTTAETPKGMTKLLVATGNAFGSGDLNSVEVVNLDESNPNLICDNLPNFPIFTTQGNGHLYVKRTPIVCDVIECYTFFNGTWNSSPSLNERRAHSASAIFSNPNREEEDIIIITGGIFDGNVLSSVESFDGQIWSQARFPALPNTLHSHCMVKINSSMLLLIGGVLQYAPDDASSSTYFFDVLNNQWITGPQLNSERFDHSCGVMYWINPDTGTTEHVVVVAGGIDKNWDTLSSVELLFLNDYETSKQGWTFGPTLPETIFAASMTEFKGGVIFVGGLMAEGPDFNGHNLYQLSTPTGPWTEMKQTLKQGRFDAVSFLIPDELANCQ